MEASSEETIPLDTNFSAPCLQGGARARLWERQPIKFSVKGPQLVGIDDEIMLSGCSILDIAFASPSEVGELVFKNYYTASISILVKLDQACWASNGEETPAGGWVTAIASRKLMGNPHYEQGSQDMISLAATQSLVEWYNLTAMRFILRQPSPIWNTFHVEEINFYQDLPRLSQDHKTHGLVSQAHHQQLLNIVTKQTRESLNWARDLKSVSSPRICIRNEQKGPCGYEITRLPQIA